MTQDDVIRLAREAGFEDFDNWSRHYPNETKKWCERMETFAKLVAEHEREEIAQFIEQTNLGSLPEETAIHYALLLKSYATAIRARGQNER